MRWWASLFLIILIVPAMSRAGDSTAFEHEFTGLTFDLPHNWRATDAQTPGGFTVTSPKMGRDDPYLETMSLTVAPMGNRTLAQVLEANKAALKQLAPDAGFFEERDVQVGPDPAHRRVYTATLDKTRVQAAQLMILRDHVMYLVTLTTIPSEYGQHETIFGDILDSARFGPEFKRVVDVPTGITVELPRSWLRRGQQNNGTITFIDPPRREGGPSEAFVSVRSVVRADTTLGEVRQFAANALKAADPTAEVLRVEDARAGRVEAVFVEASRKLGARPVHSYTLLMPFNGRMYTAELVSDGATFAGRRELFDRILKSVRLRGDNEKWYDPALGFHIEFPGAWVPRYGENDILATFTAPPESRKVPTTQRVTVRTLDTLNVSLDEDLARQIDQRKTADGATLASAMQKYEIAGEDARTVELDIGKDPERIHLRLILFNHHETRFLVTVEATATIFQRNAGVFDEIVQSIRFD